MAAHFTAKGKRYELATVDSLSFDEAREVKRISGYSTGPLVMALAETDPDAWLGLFVVSMRRVEGDTSPADLANENLIEMVDSVEGDEGPPAGGAKAPEDQEPAGPVMSQSTNGGTGETSPSADPASPDAVEAPS